VIFESVLLENEYFHISLILEILWPENIAPADWYVIILKPEHEEKANQLISKLISQWKEVIFDDRVGKKFGFGQKIKDAELMWIPNIAIISDKTLEQGWYEKRVRKEDGTYDVEIVNL